MKYRILFNVRKRKISDVLFVTWVGGLLLATFFAFSAYAAPPTSKYTPAETLDPSCSPGDTNCSVDMGVAPFFTATSTTATSTFAGSLTIDTSGFVYSTTTQNVGIGTTSPYARLSVVGEIVGAYFTGTTTATSTFAGQINTTFAPVGAHDFGTWAIDAASSAFEGSPLLVNSTSAAADSNLLGLAVNGGVKFLVDAEGDIFANTLTLVGGTTQGASTISTLTVENNTNLGDATTTDKVYFNSRIGTHLIPTIDNVSDIGDTTNWLGWRTGLFNTSIAIEGTATSTGSQLTTSGAYLLDSAGVLSLNTTNDQNIITGDGFFGIGTTTPTSLLTVGSTTPNSIAAGNLYNSAFISGDLEVDGAIYFSGTFNLGTDVIDMVASFDSSGNLVGTSTPAFAAIVATSTTASSTFAGAVGIGTTTPMEEFTIAGGDFLQVIDSAPELVDTYVTSAATGVDVAGDYAYVADGANGLRIFDISSTTIRLISTLDTDDFAYGVDVVGTYAYIADDDTGIVVVDISDVNNPKWISQYDMGKAENIDVVGSYAYLTNSSAGFTIMDISDPAAPKEVATLDTGNVNDIYVQDGYAYIADQTNDLVIVDVRRPDNPIQISTLTLNGTASGIYVVGSYAYVADGAAGLTIVDISDPSSPVKISNANGVTQAGNVFVAGNYAYVGAAAADGVAIYDIQNPVSPVAIGEYNTAGVAGGIVVEGNRIYVADGLNGLVVLKIPGIDTPSIRAGSILAGSISTRSDLDVANNLSVDGSLNIGQGGLFSQGAGAFSLFSTTSLSSLRALTANIIDSNTSSIVDVFSLRHMASSTAVDGIGTGLLFEAEDDDGNATSTSRIASIFTDVTNDSPNSALTFSNKNTEGSLTEWMRLDSDGNLGIGTTSPYAKLSVVGETVAAYFTATTTSDNTFPNLISTNATTTNATSTNLSISGNLLISGDYINDFAGTGLTVTGNALTADLGTSVTLTTEVDGVLPIANGGTNSSSLGSDMLLTFNGTSIVASSSPTAAVFFATSTTATSTFAGGLTIETSGFVYDFSTNNVGIGTAAPAEQFTVSGGNILQVADATPALVTTLDTSGSSNEVYVSGDYAYVADGASGLQIIDISSTTAMLVGTIDTSSSANDVHVVGNYAYVANGLPGLDVMDVSNPTAPSLIGTLDTTAANGLYVVGNYAYVADGTAGLQIIDISDPTTPVLVGTLDTGTANDVYVQGGYAYLADSAVDLAIVDVRRPDNPILASTLTLNAIPNDIYVSGNYAYVADGTAGLTIVDVSDVSAPVTVSNLDEVIVSNNIYVSGRYAYMAASATDGVGVYDISNPLVPVEIGEYNTAGVANGIFVEGDRIYVADGASGLLVLEIPGIDTPAIRTGSLLAHNISTKNNIDAGNDLYVGGGVGIGQGGLFSQGAGAFSLFSTTSLSSLRALTANIIDSNTSSIVDVFSLRHMASSTAVDGIGTGLLFEAEDDDGNATSTSRIASIFTDVTNDSPNSALTFSNKNTEGSLTEWMRLDSNGNLGLGTTSPYARLSVVGEVVSEYFTATSTTALSTFAGSVGIGTTSPYAKLSVVGEVVSEYFTATSTTATSTFAGAVGIGTTSPMEEFTISGGNFLQVTDSTPALVMTLDTAGVANEIYVSGDYAYVADGTSGLQIIDISSTTPMLVGTLDVATSYNDVHVAGDYAYFADSSAGLDIIDVSNPAAPVSVSNVDTTTANGIYVSGHYAYIADGTAGLQIIDISDPTAPVIVGTLDTGTANDVYVMGGYAYVADSTVDLAIVDVRDPSDPILASSLTLNAVPNDVYVSGSYAYVADGTAGITIVDISDPTSPSIVSNLDTVIVSNNIFVSGRYAYTADSATDGVHVYDISNPQSIVDVAEYNTAGVANGIFVQGDRMYVADGTSGLLVLEIPGIDTPAIRAGSVLAYNVSTKNNIDISHNLFVGGSANIGNGGIFSAGPLAVGVASTTASNQISATFKGLVGIGTTSPTHTLTVGGSSGGYLCVDDGSGGCNGAGTTAGDIYYNAAHASYTDIAERFPSNDNTIAAGEVVALDASNEEYVVRATNSSDTIIGVVSTQPGLYLGDSRDIDGPLVALSGRVPVKVNDEGGIIKIGDRLTLSSTPGVATKATTSAQTTVGIALSMFLTPGAGEVTMFVETNRPSNTSQFYLSNSGNIGIGTTSPDYLLHVEGEIAAQSFVNISTKEAKNTIVYLNEDTLDSFSSKLKDINLATYHYNHDSEDEPLRLGLIAEEAPIEILSAGGKGIDLYKMATFSLGVLKDQQVRIDDLEARMAALEERIDSNIGIGGVINVIQEEAQSLVSLAVDRLTVGSETLPTAITIYDAQGQPGCLTVDDVSTGALNVSAGACDSGEDDETNPSSTSGSSAAPSITLTGPNPLYTPLNTPFIDPGFYATDDSGMNPITGTTGDDFDTSINATHTIYYTATDNHQNTSTTTRTVIVGEGSDPLPPVVEEEPPVEEAEEETATSTPPIIEEEPPVEEEEVVEEEETATSTPPIVEEEPVEEPEEEVVEEETATSTPEV